MARHPALLSLSAVAFTTLALTGAPGCGSRDEQPAQTPQAPATAAESPTTGEGSANVVFEITGSGTVYSIDVDPGGRKASEDTPVPWTFNTTVGPDVQLLQVIAVGKTGSQGCRITLDGKVVTEQTSDQGSHCTFQR